MVEILRRFKLNHKAENTPVPTIVEQIKHKALKAANVWHNDRIPGKDKRNVYSSYALELSQLITHELIEDPNFHQQLSPKVHIKAIQPLATFVPDQKGYDGFRNDPNSMHRKIVGYLKGFVEHNKSYLLANTNGNGDISNEKLLRSLRLLTYMPRYYIEEICEEIGLCPKPSVKESANGSGDKILLPRPVFEVRKDKVSG